MAGRQGEEEDLDLHLGLLLEEGVAFLNQVGEVGRLGLLQIRSSWVAALPFPELVALQSASLVAPR